MADCAVRGYARPDWFIFGALAEKLGRAGPQPKNAGQILREIGTKVAGFPASPDRRPRRLQLNTRIPWEKARTGSPASGQYHLILEPGGFRHRGIDMSLAVEGLSELALEEGFRFHPDDLDELGIGNGGRVILGVDGVEVSGAAKADLDCPRGTVWFYRPFAYGGIPQRANLAPLYRFGGSLLSVTVSGPGAPNAEGAEAQVSAGGGGEP